MQIFIQRIYSFKKIVIIHSMKIFIHLKNGLSPTPIADKVKIPCSVFNGVFVQIYVFE